MTKSKSLRTIFDEAETRTTIRNSYELKDQNDTILLSVIPGDTGQVAMTNVYLGQKKIIDQFIGNIDQFDLGFSDDLNLKRLRVITIITDVEGKPDLTSFEIKLSGGISLFQKKVQLEVSEQGETIGYEANIKFFR